MLCTYGYLYAGEHFSEFRKECAECHRFNECLMANDTQTAGDNFPTYEQIHTRLKASNDRRDMVTKLLQAQEPPISKEEITDFVIDINIYNDTCKPKVEKHLKRRTKKK